jgi:signal transduction histidine kinase
MDITEVEAGAMKLQLQSVSLPSLAEEIVELYQHVAEEKGVMLISRAQNDLTVRADANRLRQAIANLVDNAVKYTPAGGTVCVVADVRKGVAALTVEDTGIGIPSEEQSRVWERLYRTDASRSARGLGLGLSLVRAIMQAHQGSAELVSTPGSGSAFTLTFPLVKA